MEARPDAGEEAGGGGGHGVRRGGREWNFSTKWKRANPLLHYTT
jgi:hypothetical protein